MQRSDPASLGALTTLIFSSWIHCGRRGFPQLSIKHGELESQMCE